MIDVEAGGDGVECGGTEYCDVSIMTGVCATGIGCCGIGFCKGAVMCGFATVASPGTWA